MRRGLIRWDADELPVSVLHERVHRLQSAMVDAGLDAIVLYTNFIRCAAVSWLTGFSPYWGDGIVVVTREGQPLLSTMLSKRMEGWIQSVMPAAAVATSPAPGKVVGTKLTEAGAGRVGVVEADDFPSGHYSDLAAASPNVLFADGTAVFAQARSPADEAERRLLSRANEIAAGALSALIGLAPRTAGDAAAAVEKKARLDGAEEIYVAIAADLDQSRTFLRLSGSHALGRRFAVRATVAYKGSWVRRIRTFSQNSQDLHVLRRADAWFAEVIATARPEKLGDEIGRQVTALPKASLQSWFAEAPVGTRPLTTVAANNAAPARILTAALDIGALPWCGAALMRFP